MYLVILNKKKKNCMFMTCTHICHLLLLLVCSRYADLRVFPAF